MTVKFGLLALLADGSKYGYQLRTEFDVRTAGTWPVNVGQIYTTLERLERDALVAAEGANADGRVLYALTDAGRAALQEWFRTPVAETDRPRNELAVKLLMAATTPGVDVGEVVQRQRTETMRLLRDCTTARRAAGTDVAAVLLLDSLVFALEGEIRWLDHVEATVLRHGGRLAPPATPRRPVRRTAGTRNAS
jgi:DNA-binding PadR family transcriptional regulator